MNFRGVTMEMLAAQLSATRRTIGRRSHRPRPGASILDVEFAPQPLRSDGSDPALGDRPSSDAPSIYTALIRAAGAEAGVTEDSRWT